MLDGKWNNWFGINIDIRQDWLRSPWLFNFYKDFPNIYLHSQIQFCSALEVYQRQIERYIAADPVVFGLYIINNFKKCAILELRYHTPFCRVFIWSKNDKLLKVHYIVNQILLLFLLYMTLSNLKMILLKKN